VLRATTNRTCPRLVGVIQYRPLERTQCVLMGARIMAGRLTLDQPAIILGIGATAARHALDVEIGVRIPDPQPKI
jgi:hypothetical protein